MPRVLFSSLPNEEVRIKAKHIHGSMRVASIEEAYITTIDQHGNGIKVPINEITEIKRLRWFNASSKVEHTEAIGEALIYAPLIPVAIVVTPFLKAMGLDAQANAQDSEKSHLVYVGMSKEELETYIGKPKEKYYCSNKTGQPSDEVWIFEPHQVLRGGRVLFIDLESNQVYHNAHHASYIKSNHTCSLITK